MMMMMMRDDKSKFTTAEANRENSGKRIGAH